AHVDVVVADPARWQRFARRVKQDAPAAVRRLDAPRVRLRCAEGSLGPIPDWLQAALSASEQTDTAGITAGIPSRPGVKAPWWHRLLPGGPAGRGSKWRYRRLVLEPVPYAVEPALCRRVLDTALQATIIALTHTR
ncbi:MAG: hypothetical protein ACRDI2_16055, partial [Chloroflexota bacterium]